MPSDRPVALITGAARGLGLAIAERLQQDDEFGGYATCVVDIHDRRLEELSAREQSDPDRWMVARADVTDFDGVSGIVDRIVERWGRLDLLVNNAGLNRRGGILEHTIEDWNAVLAVNLTGTFNCSRAAAPVMRDAIAEGRQPAGVIVSIGSTAGSGQGDGSIAYATTKGGIHIFTKSIANELGPLGIRAYAIAPGLTLTEWVERNLGDTIDDTAARVPLRRVGQPEDVANLIAFLASDQARQITGHVITVSGGEWMP